MATTMPSPDSITPFSPFFLLTPRLIIIPTPIAIDSPSYRALYASLYANTAFCEMGFGHHLSAVTWSDAETRETIHTRDVVRNWQRRGLGDFAVGLRFAGNDEEKESGEESEKKARGSIIDGAIPAIRVVEGEAFEEHFRSHGIEVDDVEWVAYAGVRDATTTSMPAQTAGDEPLPPWREMIEVRYGVSLDRWGEGIAREAIGAIMQWAVSERGVKRFVANTMANNSRSGKILENVGFRKLSGIEYWKEDGTLEWEKVVR